LKIGERLGLATSTQLGYAVQFTHDTVSAGSMGIQKLDFPLQQSIGLDYRFQNILEARIFFDFVYTFWEDFKDNWNPALAYDNTINFRGGVEHIFFNKVPFRVGFDYRTLRESKNYSQTLVSIGSGFYLDKVRIDLAAGLSGLNYFQKDLYDNANYGLLTSTEADRVNWSELYARIDLNYSF
jgi:long-subunit fatty acid transport protein